MSRTVRDAKLENRTARDGLKPKFGAHIHWRTIVPGQLHIGYRRRQKGKPGVWLVRRYQGLDANGVGRYTKETIKGIADDYEDADGVRVFSFAQAQALAQNRPATPKGDLTVSEAMRLYLNDMNSKGKASAAETERRAALHILPTLGSTLVADLTTKQLNEWRDALAASAAMLRSGKGRPKNFREAPDTDQTRRQRRCTANNSIAILKAALNFAHRTDDSVRDDRAWRVFEVVRGRGGRPARLSHRRAGAALDQRRRP